MNSRKPTRAELRTELADYVRELTEPRHHVEAYERGEVGEVRTTKRGKKARPRRVRRQHRVTLPPLLVSLIEAARPSSADTGGNGGGGNGSSGYESRPSVNIEAVAVVQDIRRGAAHWVGKLRITETNLYAALRAFVSAEHTDAQLNQLVHQVHKWVTDARIVTGFDAPAVTLNQPCPECGARNTLVVNGTLTGAHCIGCDDDWGMDTINQLAELIRARQQEKVVEQVQAVLDTQGEVSLHSDENSPTMRVE